MKRTVMQDLYMYPDEGNFRVVNQGDRSEVSSGPDAAGQLQAAIDRLGEAGGGEIQLGRGEYPLSTTLHLWAKVTLAGRGNATRLIYQGKEGSAIRAWQADGIVLKSFLLVNGNASGNFSGIVIDNSGLCEADAVACKDFPEFGFILANNAFLCSLRSCRALNCGEAGFCLRDLRDKGRVGEFVPNLLNGCMAAGGGIGFVLHHALVVNLLGCAVFQTASHGFHLTYESNSVALTGCRTFQVGGDAYHCEQANEINLTGNIFCWTRGNGVVLRRTTWGNITGNEIIDNGVRTADGSLRHGILITERCRGLQVTGNAIFNWADQCPMRIGIEEDDTCYENNISGNNINYFAESGLVSKGRDSRTEGNICTAKWYQWDPEKPYPDFTRKLLESFMRDF